MSTPVSGDAKHWSLAGMFLNRGCNFLIAALIAYGLSIVRIEAWPPFIFSFLFVVGLLLALQGVRDLFWGVWFLVRRIGVLCARCGKGWSLVVVPEEEPALQEKLRMSSYVGVEHAFACARCEQVVCAGCHVRSNRECPHCHAQAFRTAWLVGDRRTLRRGYE